MRFLVTGGTGQIGRAIASTLASEGHEVIIASRNRHASAGSIQVTLGSDDAVGAIERACEPCDAIVHGAASLSHSLYDASVSVANCLGTQQVLELARNWKVRTVVYLSGVPVIGRPVQLPITEEHPAQPLTAYHASKLYGEHLVRLAENEACRAVSLRITSPSGPGTPKNRILGAFVQRALAGEDLQLAGRGLRRQNYVDVRDVAAAVSACLDGHASGVYNIAATESLSNHELALACIDELASSSRIAFTGRPDPEEGISWEVSIAKARRDLNYQPRFGIRESIRALADEYRRPQ